MTKITYLIGAGASYESLPLMESMKVRLGLFGKYVRSMVNMSNVMTVDSNKNSQLIKFSDDVDKLMKSLSEHITIDDYAKKLTDSDNVSDKEKLINLKIILSIYLLFEQLKKPDKFHISQSRQNQDDSEAIIDMMRTHLDKRYSHFYGNYINSPAKTLPDNINIVSWNYDMQFELSHASRYSCSIEKSQELLQSYPFIGEKININKSCIIKINGTAGVFRDGNKEPLISPIDPLFHEYREAVDNLIELYIKNTNRVSTHPVFYFAWENEPIVKNTRELAMKIFSNTDILVIIGYSFPTFNRKIDIQLFKNSRLRRIYLQVPQEYTYEITGRINSIPGISHIDVKPVTKTDTFYIPDEYWV